MIALLAQTAAQTATAPSDDTFLYWGFILFGASLALLALEVFVPSGGLLGVIAVVLIIGSVFAFFRYDTSWGIVATALYLVLGPVAAVFIFKLWLNSPLGRAMILGGNETAAAEEEGEEGSAMSLEHARQERLAQLQQLIGARGVALTPLHPIGVVKIEGQRIDAMAESGVIDSGSEIVVTDVYDNQIKVRAV